MVSRSGKQIGRFQIQVDTCPIDNHGTIGKCETPIRSLDWTEDGKWLLIGEEGLNDGSGQRQDDYYLVNLTTMKLSIRRERLHSVLAARPRSNRIRHPAGPRAPSGRHTGNTTFGCSSSCFSIRSKGCQPPSPLASRTTWILHGAKAPGSYRGLVAGSARLRGTVRLLMQVLYDHASEPTAPAFVVILGLSALGATLLATCRAARVDPHRQSVASSLATKR